MKKKSCTKPVRCRKVRIIVSDPYATDDSSDDEWFKSKPPTVKRIVHEINLPFQQSECSQSRCDGVKRSRHKASMQLNKPVGKASLQLNKPVGKASLQLNKPVGKASLQLNTPVGVRLRRSGKWAAEIRNPITKTKMWLGTYETREEAGKAYADKKVEFDALASSGTAVSSSVASVNSQCLPSPAPAPASASASGPCVNGDDDLSKEKMSLSKDVAASGDSTEEGFFDFSELEIPDLSFLAAEEESTVSGANGAELDFDWSLTDKDFGHMFDDYSFLDDVNIFSEIENSVPRELPDYDFTDTEVEPGDLNFVFADQLAPPLNIACP